MRVNRRRLLAAAGLSAFAAEAAAQGAGQTAPPVRITSPFDQRLAEAIAANRHRLAFDGTTFSGPAFDLLVREGAAAQFLLIGEEHGIAENPKLAAQLFRALVPAGYRRLGIEISAPMADELDRAAAARGLGGVSEVVKTPASAVGFFGMAEEAQMLADIRAALPRERNVFWGMDYEVAADRRLLELLEQAPKPASARLALAQLRDASTEAWQQYDATRSPQFLFSFASDPQLVREVRAFWPRPDARSAFILEVLEETLEINRLYNQRRGWETNARRSAFIRRNFLRHWQAEGPRRPKAMFKMGSSHLIRGRSEAETYDLGALLPEAAALAGGTAFSVMALPGAGRATAVFDPSEWTYAPGDPKDNYSAGLEPIVGGAWPDAFTLVDMRPLRPLFSAGRVRTVDPELGRVVHGFDAVLVFSGSTPSGNL